MTDGPSLPFDPFAPLRALTQARVGLGRAGHSVPTAPVLEFALAHARARDAVHAELDVGTLGRVFGASAQIVQSAAADRLTYLRRPDLGRRLAKGAQLTLGNSHDLAIIVADGLSATAANAYAPLVVPALRRLLGDWTIAPVVMARQARVALGDEIAVRLGARSVVILLGERPGLSADDSLGAYVTWAPRLDSSDSDRNCVSNIRAGGLAPEEAAERIAWLLREARRLDLSGVRLKDRFGGPKALEAR